MRMQELLHFCSSSSSCDICVQMAKDIMWRDREWVKTSNVNVIFIYQDTNLNNMNKHDMIHMCKYLNKQMFTYFQPLSHLYVCVCVCVCVCVWCVYALKKVSTDKILCFIIINNNYYYLNTFNFRTKEHPHWWLPTLGVGLLELKFKVTDTPTPSSAKTILVTLFIPL